jgi:ribosome maturation factor RimP
MATRVSALTELFEPAIEAMGYTLWGVEYIAQGRHSLLRVYLDKEGGINIDDCELVSRQISGILDVEDPISGEYTLEVSSPGVGRGLFKLGQYTDYLGWMVKLRLKENFEKRRNFTGQLKAVVDDEVVLIVGDEEYTIPFELVEKASLVSEV